MFMLLLQPKYYDGDYNKMLKILIGCKDTGCTFLVGGRNVDGAFKVVLHMKRAILILVFLIFKFSVSEGHCAVLQVLDDFDVPEELKDMFISIPAEQFRVDISSTEIRKRSGM